MKLSRRLSYAIVVALVTASLHGLVRAEDIDLFTGSPPTTGNPNVLIIIDNSSNWAAQSQHWTDDSTQGQSELRAIKTILDSSLVTDKINIGLMMLTAGTGTTDGWQNKDGGFVRFAVRTMNDTNKNALKELIGDANCQGATPGVAIYNSVATSTRDCIYQNASSGTLNESIGTNVDYSATMFEAFKYFGGYTDPTDTASNPEVAGTPTDRSHFGPYRYSGNPDGRDDSAAFVDGASGKRDEYIPPITEDNNCGKNYIIFIGNGFPVQDAPASLLSGVGGSTDQLAMPGTSTSTTTQTDTIGQSCGTGNNNSQRLTNCTANISQSLKDANPGYDTYSCTGTGVVDTTTCPGSTNRRFDVQGSKTIITVSFTDTTSAPSTSELRYADEWAKYLFDTDVSSVSGTQNVRTYTIDVFKDNQDSRQTRLLYNMATKGGGKYFTASSYNAILEGLTEILVDIQAQNSVFAAASLPVSATNRAQNENQVFFGMFRPDGSAKPRWYGNLKRYQVAQDSTTKDLFLADKNGTDAVSLSTGFFNPCSESFWTSDSGTYWQNVSGALQQQCATATTSVYSDLPDGPQVEKGGAAEVVRKGNNPPTTDTTPTYTVNRTIYTCVDESAGNCSTVSGAASPGMVTFDTTNVTAARLGVSATDQPNTVAYTRGQDKSFDIIDEQSNGTTDDTRATIHGDVVHSRPLPVNYNGAGSHQSEGVVMYYGGNDGLFRAVRSSDGKELWAFIAPEHHSKLKRLWENSPLIKYPNVTDASAEAKDYFFDGTPGLYQNADNSAVWIYPTMRRGGRMIYGFDVTDPTAPILKWRVGCPDLSDDTGCTSGLEGIGQTWSIPSVAFIKGYSPFDANDPNAGTPVIIVGGGYDECEDDDNSTPTCGSAKGRKVFVLNAFTGELLASFDTDRSVPADVALLERDFDGNADHAYVADTGGNLYRIDFVNASTKAALPKPASVAGTNCTDDPDHWCITKIGHTESTDGRKFLFPPAVFFGSSGGNEIAILTIGSGDRERPLYTNYPHTTPVLNRFYAFVDTFSTDSSAAVNFDTDNSITDITSTTLSPPDGCLPNIRGWRMDLEGGTCEGTTDANGEQVVTSSLISGGKVFFNTHQALTPAAGTCNADLGCARGYSVDLFCGSHFSVVYEGGGIPISPVQGTVTLDSGAVVTFVIGGPANPNATNPFTPGQIRPSISPTRKRLYWYRHGDK